ncbi:MAG: tRNA uridine(34) 5-carboxymethylaminomethyl modification radical SAM/GNAT enzyme Elp3 [Candidatus Peregrinibacteria bacterium]
MPFPKAFQFGAPELALAREILLELLKAGEKANMEDIKNIVTGKKGVSTISNISIISAYQSMVAEGIFPETPWIVKKIQKRSVRTLSGIAPITVLTKPFPCPGKCVYCPTERVPESGKTLFQIDSEKTYGDIKINKKYQKKGALVMPKSYLSSEPAAMRALLNNFDPYIQVQKRLLSLKNTGHNPEKCELIVLGGTFSFLPKRYQTWFVKRCIQAFNTDNSTQKPLATVIAENETAPHRAIGIVLETRPDHLNANEIKRFRAMGCTRVEMGVQTLDDAVSALTKRGHGKAEVKTATKLLRDAGFKIAYHMMPGLPGSTEEGDLENFREIFTNPDYCPDYLKVYPCLVTPFSELEQWHKDGKFNALSGDELIPRLLEIKKMTPPWVRISRLIRDIPGTAIVSGSQVTNLRQYLEEILKKAGTPCQCIRCREVKGEEYDLSAAKLFRQEYDAGDGKEIFLSIEIPALPSQGEGRKLLALLRLRIPSWFFDASNKPVFSALKNCALIREVHTYGALTDIQDKTGTSTQHRGFGKRLLQEAERIVREEYGISKLAIISGIGVREYYRSQGYEEDSTYMIKNIEQ